MTTTRRTQTQTRRFKDELEDAIVNGRLKPGDRVDPEALAREYGVSRTPVREALQQLAASGLVRIAPKYGTFIAELSLTQLVEMFEVMAELEGMAGRLAARRITTEQAEALRSALTGCQAAAEAGDCDRYYYENEQFHDCIYTASHNSFLAEHARQLQSRLKPYRRLQLRVPQRMKRSLSEHAAIVDALLRHDETATQRALIEHVLIQGERFGDLVSVVNTASQ